MHCPIVSFRRTGTHALAELLYRNLETGAASPEELCYSHSRLPDVPYVTTYRKLLPTMVSFWRMRERFGVHRDVPFAAMLRIPYDLLTAAESCDVTLDGEAHSDAHRITNANGLVLPEMWVRDTLRFTANAAAVVDYDDLQGDPLSLLKHVSAALHLPYKQCNEPVVLERVGWLPNGTEQPCIGREDLVYLSHFQARCDIVRR